MKDNILLDKTNLLLTISILILLVFNISLVNYKILTPNMHNNEIAKQYEAYLEERKNQEDEEQRKLDNDEWTKEEIAENELIDLKSMGEASRMYKYLYSYLEMIEWWKYEEAYNTLYEDFKVQYFPTLESYTEYVKERYPDFMSVDYNNIDRQGEYYIVTATIRSIVNENSDMIQQRFVLHEKALNDFEISFQVF